MGVRGRRGRRRPRRCVRARIALANVALLTPSSSRALHWQDIFARVARAELGYVADGPAWLAAHLPAALRLANFSLQLRLSAVANASSTGPTKGLVWGPPEHDTCHEPDYYYHVRSQETGGGGYW